MGSPRLSKIFREAIVFAQSICLIFDCVDSFTVQTGEYVILGKWLASSAVCPTMQPTCPSISHCNDFVLKYGPHLQYPDLVMLINR